MVGRFTRGLAGAIVATGGGTIGQNGLTMIKRRSHRQPRGVAMAEFAGVTGGRMIAGFARGAAGAIVTACITTTTGKLIVIEVHLPPIAGAGVAGVAG